MGWLTNSSYQPPPVVKHLEDGAPPSKKVREGSRSREKEPAKRVPSAPAAKPATHWLEESGLAPQEAYRLDPAADRANLQYSALYSGDIAVYRRRFGGQCLGLGPHQSIEWTDNRGSKLPKKSKEKGGSRYFTSKLPHNESCLYLGGQPTLEDAPEIKCSHAPFFIALEFSRSTPAEGEESGNQQLTSEVFVSQQTASYNRVLQEDPHNVALWLEFLEHQPALQNRGGEGGQGTAGEKSSDTLKAARALKERKLAIFERALEHNPTSEPLLVAQLELLKEMDEEPQAVMKRWRDLAFRMPNKPLIWLKYTEFCCSQFSTFSLSSLASLYHKGISTLTSIYEGVMKSHRPEPGTQQHLLALFSQFCHCLAAAGQNERAVACYQALVEFNLCCPPDVASTTETSRKRADFFEPFWDSGAPRLGEPGAVGWSQWVQGSQSQQPTKPLAFIDTHIFPVPELNMSDSDGEDPEISLISGCTLPEAWVRLENYRQQNDTLPFRGSDDDLTDPERTVLFEDVCQSLFSLGDHSLQLQLVLGYLQFLGVQLSHGGAPCLDHLPHLISPHLYCPYCTTPPAEGNSILVNLSLQSLNPHSFCGVGSGYCPLSIEDLLQSRCSHPLLPAPLSRFISHTFNQVLCLLPDPHSQTVVALEWVRFELSLVTPALGDPARSKTKETKAKMKAVQKLVKSLLRHEAHRNDLALWDCCAQLECQLGGVREARTLYESVLSQYTTISPPLLPLYQHYCEILMGLAAGMGSTNADTLSRALQLTLCVAEGKYKEPTESVPPGSILRARHLYEQSPSRDSHCSYHLCHVYFEYLSRGLDPACRVFDKLTSTRQSLLPTLSSPSTDSSELRTAKSELHTLYHQQVALLLCHAESNKPVALTLLWGVLERALALFPDNPFFLSAYTDSHQPLYLMGKLRKYFDSRTPKAQTALPWVHAVRAEVARYKRVREGEMEGATDVPAGLVNRTRALLNRAIQSVNGRGCPLLWRLAMNFEVSLLLYFPEYKPHFLSRTALEIFYV